MTGNVKRADTTSGRRRAHVRAAFDTPSRCVHSSAAGRDLQLGVSVHDGARPAAPNSSLPSSAAAVRPALALTAAEEVETIRRVLLEAATSTTRET